MGLDKGEVIVGVAVAGEKRVEVVGIGRGKEHVAEIKGADFAAYVSRRALKGRALPDKVRKPSAVRVPGSDLSKA
jgi:hypothetical protein